MKSTVWLCILVLACGQSVPEFSDEADVELEDHTVDTNETLGVAKLKRASFYLGFEDDSDYPVYRRVFPPDSAVTEYRPDDEDERPARYGNKRRRYPKRRPSRTRPAIIVYEEPRRGNEETSYEKPAPAYPKPAPVYPKPAPVYPKPAPVYPKPAPVYPKPAPVYPKPAPVYPKPAPVYPKPAPVYPKPAPVYPKPAPVYPKPAPVYPKPPPVYPKPPPVYPKPAPVYPAPVYPTYPEPVYPKPAPVYPKPAPIYPTYPEPVYPIPTPVYPKPAPVYPKPAPVYPKPAPVYPTPAPIYPTYPEPVYPKPAPVYPKPAPVYPKPPPVYPKPAPVYPKPAPVYPAPVYPTYPEPVYPKPAPVYPKPAPIYPTYPEPVYPKPAPIYPKPAPVYPKPAPVYPKPAPVYPKPAPIYPKPAPTVPYPTVPKTSYKAEKRYPSYISIPLPPDFPDIPLKIPASKLYPEPYYPYFAKAETSFSQKPEAPYQTAYGTKRTRSHIQPPETQQVVHVTKEMPKIDPIKNNIRGEPGRDYPILSSIPRTGFTCAGRPAGFYGDQDTACQVWHICDTDSRKESFLCVNGTVYNQAARVCDWWYNVDCESTSALYSRNHELFKTPMQATFEDESSEEEFFSFI